MAIAGFFAAAPRGGDFAEVFAAALCAGFAAFREVEVAALFVCTLLPTREFFVRTWVDGARCTGSET